MTKEFLDDLAFAMASNPGVDLISLLFWCAKSVGKQQRPMTNRDWAIALKQYRIVIQAEARRV